MIRFYTDKDWITDKNRKRIFPLFLDIFYLKNQEFSNYFVFEKNIEIADLAIFPIDITYIYKKRKVKLLDDFIQQAQQKGIKIWLFSGGDIGKTIKNENVIIFRLGGFDSKMDSTTQIVPSFVQDAYKNVLHKEFITVQKNKTPQIGFVGHANGTMRGIIHEFLVFLFLMKEMIVKNFYIDYQSFYPSGYHRYKLLKKISSNKNIHANFILRNNYLGGSQQQGEIKNTTLEFYENMNNNPYIFCMRGLGNFSVRFYETLMMGRIPVLPKTDMRLPLHASINWKKHCVFVEKDTFVEDLSSFHNTITPFDFEQMQIENRKLATTKLTRIGYFVEQYNQWNK